MAPRARRHIELLISPLCGSGSKENCTMNMNLMNAIDGIQKADAMMYAIETSFLDVMVGPEEQERLNRGTSAFYVLWDIINGIDDDLQKLQGDELVVDAVYAVMRAKEMGTLKTEK